MLNRCHQKEQKEWDYRPGVEPIPSYMRRAIENWFEEQDLPKDFNNNAINYGAERGGEVWTADDADVTALAAPAARIAIDLLLGRSPSIFPHSVYVIGLAPVPPFNQPFQTFPIDVGEGHSEEPKKSLPQEESLAEIDKIAELYQALADGTETSS